MKITRQQLKQIIKEEIKNTLNEQEVDLAKLEPVADTVVGVVEKELDKVDDTEKSVLVQAVISKLQGLAGDGEQS